MLLLLTFEHRLTIADGIKNITNVHVAMNYIFIYVLFYRLAWFIWRPVSSSEYEYIASNDVMIRR
jgi:nitrate reductase gamma subunit